MRGLGQVHAQEGEVDLGHAGQLRDGGDDLVVVEEDVLGHLQLLVLVVQHVAVEQVGHGVEVVLIHVHEVRQRLADDGVQDHEEGHGQEGPQAAGGGLDPFFLIELLQLAAVFFPVPGVFLLQHALLFCQAAHGEHSLPAFQKDGEEDQADHQAKQDQGDPVAAGDVVEQQQQFGEGGKDNVQEIHVSASRFDGSRRWSGRDGKAAGSGHGVILDALLFVKGVAAQDAAHGKEAPLEGAVFFHGLQGIGRAGGDEAAAGGTSR